MTWHYWAFLALMTFLGFAAGWEFATRRIRKRVAERLGVELNDPPFLRIRKVDEAPALYFFIFGGLVLGAVLLIALVLMLATE